jgi:HisA/HisF family protein
MRIIPVLDLKGGLVVHAVRGERSRYAPVRSVLTASAEPLAVAGAFRTALGLSECYVADLDAIARQGDHAGAIRSLAGAGLAVWLDAGVSTAAEAKGALALGVVRVVVGTETLRDVRDLAGIVAALRTPARPHADPANGRGADAGDMGRAVLSLDLRDGALLGGSPALGALDPVELACTAWTLGVRAFIVLELSRVGSGGGVETGTPRRLRTALPDAEIVVGGGIRDAGDLKALASEGFDAALVATALHAGTITATTLAALT